MIRLSFLLSVLCLLLSRSIFAQVPVSPPPGTNVTLSSATPFAYALTGGLNYSYTNSSWPAFNTSCYGFAINDTLFNAINGYNQTAAGGPCSGMTNLVYNAGLSNLPAGIIVYTGLTRYRYQNTSSVFVVNNSVSVRATVTFSSPVIYYPNNTFVVPVTGNFSYSVLMESLAPNDAQYVSGSGNTWVPSKTLFNNMVTASNNSICVNFTPGNFTLNTVSANTAPTGIICQGGNIQLTGGGTGNNLAFNWTGPNAFTSTNPSATINNATSSNSGTYFLTATDDMGCPNTVQSIITVQQPPVSIAGGTSIICVNGSATVSGASSANGNISWTHNGSGSLLNNTTLTPTYIPSSFDAGHTVVLTLKTTSNNSCAPALATATYTIIVEGNPIAADGVISSICSSSSFTITTANAQFGTINWTHNGNGTLTNANTVSPTYTPSILDNGNTVILTMTVTSTNACAPATAQAFHVLNVAPLPQAISGGIATICENSSVTVSGAIATNGTFSWSHNGTGTLTNPTSISPTYSAAPGDVGNIVTLTLTVSSNNACGTATSTADFSVTVQGLPTASVNNSSTICSNSSATVSGVTAANGIITWTHNGSGFITNSSTLTPTYTPSILDAGNTVSLTITVSSNNSCAPSSVSAIYPVTVNNLPKATVGGNATICESNPYTVTGASFNYGTADWTHNGFGTITNGNTASPTYTPGPTDAGNAITLTLNVTSNNACAPTVASATISLIVQHAPIASAGGTTTVCVNSTAPVTGATATYGTINWTHDGDGILNNPTTLGPLYNPVSSDAGDTITLTLTVTSVNACAPQTASATYTVYIDPLPSAIAGGSSHICAVGGGTVSGVTAVAGSIFWSSNGSGTISNPTTTTPTYVPAADESGHTVILSMELLSNNSCFPAVSYANYTFFIDPAPTIEITDPTDTLCPGATKLIQGVTTTNGTSAWTHNGTGTLTDANTNSPVYTAGPGDLGNIVTLTLTVTSNNGCAPLTAVSTVQVYVKASANIPNINLVNLNHVRCHGDLTGNVMLNVTGGAPPYTYQWNSGATSQSLTTVGAGIYYVDITDKHGCIATDTFKINEPAQLVSNPTIVPVDCAGVNVSRISVSASGGVGPYSYSWRDLDIEGQTISGIPAGDYKVTVIDANGCRLTEIISLGTSGSIMVEATPDVVSVNIGTEIPFTVTGATTYQWAPAQYLSCDDCDDPVCTPTSPTDYIVTGYNPNGCTGTDTVIVNVYVDCHSLTMPNVFSPNNSGPEVNNTFGLIGTLPCIENYQLLIFNRWGEQVFETQTTDLQWDGNYNGKPQNSGVYFYRLDMKLVNGEEIKKSGNLTLIR